MKKLRFDKLGIEIEMENTGELPYFRKPIEIKEKKTCVKISCDGRKVATILPDSKIEIRDIVHITCYKGRIVVFGNAYVEVGGMSRVFARNRACVVAYQGAEVRAGGRTKVRALDSSRVIAGGRAEVFLEGKSIGYRNPNGRVKMNKLDNRAAVFDLS
jgi:hypothetical protein